MFHMRIKIFITYSKLNGIYTAIDTYLYIGIQNRQASSSKCHILLRSVSWTIKRCNQSHFISFKMFWLYLYSFAALTVYCLLVVVVLLLVACCCCFLLASTFLLTLHTSLLVLNICVCNLWLDKAREWLIYTLYIYSNVLRNYIPAFTRISSIIRWMKRPLLMFYIKEPRF